MVRHKAGTHVCHGAPIGDDEIAKTRDALGWTHPAFEIPQAIYEQWSQVERGQAAEATWATQFSQYQAAYPELAQEYQRRMQGDLPENWAAASEAYIQKLQRASQHCFSQSLSKCFRKFCIDAA